MSLVKKQKNWIYFGLLLLSVLFVFFLSRKFNPETSLRYWSFDIQWAQHFRKGLDVSWGTRLTYKISYDKYEQLYKGAQLQNIKQDIEDILFKQIDKRISSLGVADAKVYKQLMDGETYINVDIWWVSDLEQAKNIIGKTVELEFRLPASGKLTEKNKQARKIIALELQKGLIAHPDRFAALSENKGGEAIYYKSFTGVSLTDSLPPLMKKNIHSITNLSTGVVSSELYSGTFSYNQISNGSGKIALEPIKWYGIFLVNDKKVLDVTMPEQKDILAFVKKEGKEVNTTTEVVDAVVEDTSLVKDWTYHWYKQIAGAGEKMYKAKVVFISGIGTGSASVDSIKTTIKDVNEFSGAKLVMNDWKTVKDITATVSSFDPTNTDKVQIYKEMNTTYVVYLSDIKNTDQYLYTHLAVSNIADDFVEKLSHKEVYDIEAVFVQDREPWSLAKTKNDKILNGAYFKFASPGVSQLGESVVEIHFNDEGKQVFCDITNENIGKQMAIFIGGEKLTDPVIRSKICWGTAQISGGYTPDTAKNLSDSLNDGALPAPLILLQEEKISPLLWDNALNNALLAGLVGIVAIFVFVLVLYGIKKAFVALWVLIMFLLMLGLFMKLVDYSLSLSAIAAVILSLGMAVDANILIFERMKEEMQSGKKIGAAIDIAYDRSWSAIKDGNVSTGIIAFLLFTMGNSIFKGFGSMLIVTVVITLFVNVPLTKILLKFFYKGKLEDKQKIKK